MSELRGSPVEEVQIFFAVVVLRRALALFVFAFAHAAREKNRHSLLSHKLTRLAQRRARKRRALLAVDSHDVDFEVEGGQPQVCWRQVSRQQRAHRAHEQLRCVGPSRSCRLGKGALSSGELLIDEFFQRRRCRGRGGGEEKADDADDGLAVPKALAVRRFPVPGLELVLDAVRVARGPCVLL
jgi:hypothetical protein